MVMLLASSRSISAAGSGTRITSTLAMIPTGKTRSCSPRAAGPAGDSDVDATPEDIHFSGNAAIGTKYWPRLPARMPTFPSPPVRRPR